MRTHPFHPTLILLLACALAIVLYFLGIAGAALHFWGRYLLPIVLVFLWGRRRDIYVVTALASVLVVVSYWTSGATTFDDFLANHLLPILILWGVAWLLAQRQQLQAQLARREQALDEQVKARTAELQASEQRYRLLAENSSDLVWAVDMDGALTYVSPSVQRLRGVTPKEEQASSWSDRMPPEAAARAAAAMQADLAALRAGQPIDATPRVAPAYRQDGTLVWSETIMSPLYDENGRPQGLCGTTRDITARHQTEEALRASEERFAKLFGASPVGITLSRLADGHYLEVNDAFVALVGYSREELVGRTSLELGVIDPEDRLRLATALQEQGCVRGVDLVIHTKREQRHVFYAVEPLDVAGEPCLLSSVVEITERKRLEEAAYLLAAIVDSSSDAIVSTDQQGLIVSWNRSAEQLYGCSTPQAMGRPISELFRPRPDADEAEIVASARMGNTVPFSDIIWTKADGTKVDLSIVLSPVQDKHGAVIGMASVARGITKRKAGERERLFLSALVASSPEAVVGRMVDGTILSWNHGAEQLFGYTPAEAIGQNLTMLATPDGLAHMEEIMAEVAQGCAVEGVETQRMTKDGRIFDCRISSFPVRDAAGAIIGVASFTHDISERKRAQVALAASEAQLREALQRLQLATEAAKIGVWSWNFAGSSLDWDERMCELHAVTAEERRAGISYTLWRARIHPDDLAIADPAQGDFAHVDEHVSITYRIVLPGGGVRNIQSTALLEYGLDGQPRRIIGVNRDVTDQVRYAQLLLDTNAALEQHVAARTADLQAALSELQRANHLKDEFMAMISHELRTPLTGVLSMAEMLKEQIAGPLNARQATYVKAIDASGERLLAVINGILGYTHLLSGKVELHAETCELAYVLAVCAASQQHKADEKNQSIAVRVEPPDLSITTDATALADVLKRLLDNAVKFTPEGGQIGLEGHPSAAPGTADLLVDADRPAGVDLVVWDTGIGIPPDQLEHIFHAFTQVDSSLQRSHEGIGLGLAYVAQMVRLLGGTIAVESEPGQGSRFTITLAG